VRNKINVRKKKKQKKEKKKKEKEKRKKKGKKKKNTSSTSVSRASTFGVLEPCFILNSCSFFFIKVISTDFHVL